MSLVTSCSQPWAVFDASTPILGRRSASHRRHAFGLDAHTAKFPHADPAAESRPRIAQSKSAFEIGPSVRTCDGGHSPGNFLSLCWLRAMGLFPFSDRRLRGRPQRPANRTFCSNQRIGTSKFPMPFSLTSEQYVKIDHVAQTLPLSQRHPFLDLLAGKIELNVRVTRKRTLSDTRLSMFI